ncbi:MAG: YdeI/OmpD-associated family protein [Bacteroidota bacterium]
MHRFNARIEIVGINPYVALPDEVLAEIFIQAKKDKGAIPVKGFINDTPFVQRLMKLKGIWRLYINTVMLKNSPKRIGETIAVQIAFDPAERIISPHPKLVEALAQNNEAKTIFDNLIPSLRFEIIRYISNLKTEESVDRNVAKAIGFLLGKERFIGRDRP